MRDIKEYIIPEDLKPGRLPHALAWYDEKTLVKDRMKAHPGETDKKAMKALMSFGNGAFNTGRIMKELREVWK